jgi:PAS domain-containing protein
VIALSIAALIFGEWLLIHARRLRHRQLQRCCSAGVYLFVAAVVFVRIYLRAGRCGWPGWYSACDCWRWSSTFLHDPNLTLHIDRPVAIRASVGRRDYRGRRGCAQCVQLVGQFSTLALFVYFADAALSVWRRTRARRTPPRRHRVRKFHARARRRFYLFAADALDRCHTVVLSVSQLSRGGRASSFQLGNDVIRATRLGEQLESSNVQLRKVHEQVDMISEAAGVGLWEWDSQRDVIWVTDQTRALYGFRRDRTDRFRQIFKRRARGGSRRIARGRAALTAGCLVFSANTASFMQVERALGDDPRARRAQ